MSASVTNPESSEPMMDINTTPLIDVMLVLLIMFIITIPVQTHAVKLDLPQATERSRRRSSPVKNVVVVLPDGAILWNGASGHDSGRCASISTSPATCGRCRELHLQPHAEARYEVVDEVLAQTKLAKITDDGLRRQRILCGRLPIPTLSLVPFREGGGRPPPFFCLGAA